jgi:hypothetical protein
MDWVDTPESSNIARFSYDSAIQVLKIEFKKGGTYSYFDVPDQVFESMRNAPSKGQHLAQQIKGRYRYARD